MSTTPVRSRTPLRAALTLGALVSFAFHGTLGAQQASIPTPESVLGFTVGADFKLATYDESIRYFQRLAAASDRIKLVSVGKTSTGHDWTLAIISSPANLAKLGRYREIAQRLAHPTGLSDREARALAREGKAFVDISGGLHASEIAGSQHTIQLAYDILSNTADPKIAAILENTVLFLWPSINPDGQNIVVDWYREVVGTPYEVSPLHELYQKNIGHDNNRDGYMLNVVESRVVARTWREWEPHIIYVQHQTAPFPTRIWLPPFAEPVGARVNGLLAREVNTIGMTIAQQLETEGKVGATHMGTGFDAWYPGYIDYLPMYQNIAAFWTETALYQYATPHFYTLRDFPSEYRDLRPQSLYPSPWAGGWWRLRDAVDYMRTASMAVLDYAVKYREDLLWNRYQAGRNTIAKYAANPPYAYVVPQDQRDPGNAVEMLRRLAFNGLRVHQLDREARLDGVSYAKGTWVLPMDQEFGELAREVLETQEYPDLREYPGGPPEQPYDAAGWTLPYQMDVRVVAALTPLTAEFRAAMRPVRGTPTDPSAAAAPFSTDAATAGIVAPPSRVTGAGDRLALDPAQNNSFRALSRALTDGARVQYDGGKYVVSGTAVARAEAVLTEFGGSGERRSGTGGARVADRIAIFRPWTASMDEGWTEWLLDTYGFAYTAISNADIKGGELNSRFDVILFASERSGTITDGFTAGTVPARYAGGIGEDGTRALDAFVRNGGTMVMLNQSADFAIKALHLPVKNVLEGVARKDFFTGASILEVITDASHPVMAGMPERAKVFVEGSPAFSTLEGFEGAVLAQYASQGSPLLSGYLLGEKYLHGTAAALDVKHGRGHVVLIGFRPQWRGQPFGTFKIVFNSILFGGELSQRTKSGPSTLAKPPAAPAAARR